MNSQNNPPLTAPRVLVYFCDRCCGAKSPLGNLALTDISDNLTSVHFKCAREVSAAQIQQGFAAGADGVLIYGCLVRDCAGSFDDLSVLQSLYRNQLAVRNLGLETERLREDWVVQGTTDHFEEVVAEFVRHLQALGPRRALAASPLKSNAGQA